MSIRCRRRLTSPATARTTVTTAIHTQPSAKNDTVYRGRAEPLPVPARMPTAEEGAEAMFTDGCVQFPGLFSLPEVAALKEWIDRSGKPDAAYEVTDWCFNKHLDADLRG